MAFPIIPKKRSGATGSPTSLTVGELAVNTATGELFLGGDSAVLLLNPPTAAGTTATERTGDGTTTAFTFSGYNGTADGGYLVSVGGIDQPPSKYAVTSTAGGTITFVEAPTAGELISIRALVASSGGAGGTDIGGRAWSATATYSIGDMVFVNGVYPDTENYVSIQNANIGNNPYSVSGFWRPLTATALFLQGKSISTTEPVAGQLLEFTGAEWEPKYTTEFGTAYTPSGSGFTLTRLGSNSETCAGGIAIGDTARAMGVAESIAIGIYATANSSVSMAIGQYAQATGVNSIAIGENTNASSAGIAIGKNAVSTGGLSIAAPSLTGAPADPSTVISYMAITLNGTLYYMPLFQ